MGIIEVTTEALDPIGANTVVENHMEVLSTREGDNKIIIEANTKATADNLCHTSIYCYHNKTPTVPHTLTQH